MHYSIPITQNQKKLIRSLHQKQNRDTNNLFVVEGEKLCNDLLGSKFETLQVIFKDSPSSDVIKLVESFMEKGVPVYNSPKHVFDQMCDVKAPQGILAVVNLKEQPVTPQETFVALDGVQDPGNVGTIIRTAQWFGINQVILGGNCADQFGPKVVRASMGSVFNVNVTYREDLAGFLKENFSKIKTYAASLDSESSLEKIKHKGKFGIVFGSESHGISDPVKELLDGDFLIEGSGTNDSLNVAVSCGITLYHFSKFKR